VHLRLEGQRGDSTLELTSLIFVLRSDILAAVPEFRYPQFCAIARAAEVVGERWTILIVRELFLGPQRFSDLRRRLSAVSPSVLSERLALLEERGLVSKSNLAPPAASVVYELTQAGHGLGPVLVALAKWGGQFLLPIRPGEQLDPDRLRFGLGLYARTAATSAQTVEFRVRRGADLVTVHARGGANGTTVYDGPAETPALVLEGEALDLVGVAFGTPEGREALRRSRVQVRHGPRAATRIRDMVTALFEIDPPTASAGRVIRSTRNRQRRK
jgi:DNA-binding HxlR family transcriptional regulator